VTWNCPVSKSCILARSTGQRSPLARSSEAQAVQARLCRQGRKRVCTGADAQIIHSRPGAGACAGAAPGLGGPGEAADTGAAAIATVAAIPPAAASAMLMLTAGTGGDGDDTGDTGIITEAESSATAAAAAAAALATGAVVAPTRPAAAEEDGAADADSVDAGGAATEPPGELAASRAPP